MTINNSGLTTVWDWQWKQTKMLTSFWSLTHESEKVVEKNIFTWDWCNGIAIGDRWVSNREAEAQYPSNLLCHRKVSLPETIGYHWEEEW